MPNVAVTLSVRVSPSVIRSTPILRFISCHPQCEGVTLSVSSDVAKNPSRYSCHPQCEGVD